jgi:hypothetical protein
MTRPGRELLKQKALAVTLEPPLVEGKKDRPATGSRHGFMAA